MIKILSEYNVLKESPIFGVEWTTGKRKKTIKQVVDYYDYNETSEDVVYRLRDMANRIETLNKRKVGRK